MDMHWILESREQEPMYTMAIRGGRGQISTVDILISYSNTNIAERRRIKIYKDFV